MRVSVLHNLMDPYNRRVLRGAADYAREAGWELNLVDVRSAAQLPEAVQCDGLLLGIHGFEHDPILTRTQIPAVSWSGSMRDMNWRRVENDDLAVGRIGAEHLLARGFRHFAFYNDVPERWGMRRRDGFLGRIESAGHSVAVLSGPKDEHNTDLIQRLRELPHPLGVMLAHDQSAIRFIAACREAGRRIPEDIAIVGVNDDEFLRGICDPPLSTIPLPTYRIGYEAASLLAKLMSRAPMPPWSIVIPPGELIVRKSSDTLATTDQLVIDAVRYIREHLSSGVGTKEVASAMKVSRTTLDTRFTAAVGRSAAAEIRRERLETARQLLATTDLPMPDVARRSGFSSGRQLSESFRHFENQSPSSYRAHYRPKAIANDGD